MNFDKIHIVRKLNAPNSEPVQRVAAKLETLAKQYNVPVLSDKDQCDETTLVIAVGGDGTMLEAMRISTEKKSVAAGVNLGNVGFLTEFSEFNPSCILTPLRDIFEKRAHHAWVHVEERVMVTATGIDWQMLAGNEITVSRDESDATLFYRLTIDNHEAGTHRANSLIVTTPTGSTAYSLSSGGALMMPNMKALQVVPVAPMTLTSRPIVVGDHSNIHVSAWGGKLAVRADGVVRHVHDAVFTKDRPFNFQVKIAQNPVKILHSNDWDFFDVLSTKLGWIKG